MLKLRKPCFQNEETFTEMGISVAGALSSASGLETGRDDDWMKSEAMTRQAPTLTQPTPSQSVCWEAAGPVGWWTDSSLEVVGHPQPPIIQKEVGESSDRLVRGGQCWRQ